LHYFDNKYFFVSKEVWESVMEFESRSKELFIREIKYLKTKLNELETTKIDLTSSMSVKMQTSKLINSILNTFSDSALILSEEGLITNYNVVAKQIICMNFDKIFGRNITDFFPVDSQKFINTKIGNIIMSGLPEHFEEERKGRIFDITIYPISVINKEIARLAFLLVILQSEKGLKNLNIENHFNWNSFLKPLMILHRIYR